MDDPAGLRAAALAAAQAVRARAAPDDAPNPQDALSFRRHLMRAVVLPVLTLAFLAGILLIQIRQQSRAAQSVDRTDQAIAALNYAQHIVLGAESAVRGYVITHDRSFLEQYDEALRTAPDAFSQAEALVGANSVQLDRIRALRRLNDEWTRYAADVVRRADRDARDVSLDEHRVGQRLMSEERDRYAQLISQEYVFRARRVREAGGFTRQATMTALIATIAFGILLTWFTRRELRMLAQNYARVLTHEKQARRSAEAASQLKDEFLGTVSHELRTPLTAILGWVQMLKSGSVPAERQGKAIDAIQRNAKAQAQLVADLLDVSRIVSGKLRILVSPVDMPRVLDDALDAVRPAATAKHITLSKSVGQGVSAVMGDAERLQQVVWNLLSNAVKFTPNGGHVRTALRRQGTQIEIEVSDDGIGIDPVLLPRVFQRFWQADSGITRGHGGLGIGLALVRHLVELHGGTVAVASEGVGLGSTFTVRVPIAPMRIAEKTSLRPRTSHVEHVSIPTDTAIEGLDVLVVDDEPDTREIVASILAHGRAEVRSAPNAEAALKMIEDSAPDVLVSDIGMPGMDGYELIARLRARRGDRSADIPAIALTAYAREADRARALAAGFDLHVAKPVAPEELTAAVARMSRRRVSKPKTS